MTLRYTAAEREISVGRVLLLAAPLGSVGGVQNYSATFFSAVKEILGAESVRLVAVSAEPKPRPDGGVSLSAFVKLRFLATGLWTAFRWRPALVICTHIGVAPVARIVHGIFGTPYWLVLHGIEVWGELPDSKRRALASADRLLAVSCFTLKTVVSRHTVSTKAAILPPAFAPANNGEAGMNPEQGRRVPESQRPTVLTVGRLASGERYKGHDVMLEAWPLVLRRIPNALYVILGDGDDRARLEAKAAELGIAEAVHFAGTVRGQELGDYYDECQVFALPARTEVDSKSPRGEGFGIVFLEAMSHGKPVVGPTVGAPAEFIRPGEHGLLVNPAKPTEIAAALIELLGDPERSIRMGRSAREWVNSEFSYDAFCRRLRKVLSDSRH